MKADTPHIIFNQLFLLRNIKHVYQEHIAIKGTRGIDRVGIGTFNKVKNEHFDVIYRKCKNGSYKFSPYVEKLQSKGRDSNPRVISVPTIRDRIVLFLIKDFLHDVFPECVNRTLPNNYIANIKEYYQKVPRKGLCYFKTDIKSFYDNIDHSKLLEVLGKRVKSKRILSLIRKTLKTPTVPINYKRSEVDNYKRVCGVPQGLSISNILANIYLMEVDRQLETVGDKYFRYVDDILIFLTDEDSDDVEGVVSRILDDYCLPLNKSKTECRLSGYGFDYLGYNLALPDVRIKEKNVERFITSIAAKFSSYIHNSDNRLKKYSWLDRDAQKKVFLADLNEKITGAISDNKRYGWLFYFLEINDISLLHKLDSIIKSFFNRMPDFDHEVPVGLKRLSKAYYKAKHDPFGGYIHNYEQYVTVKDKIKYLADRGYLNPKQRYKEEEILSFFNRIRRKRLSDLDLDIGLIS